MEMTARDINEAIAEHVMGYAKVKRKGPDGKFNWLFMHPGFGPCGASKYSSDISAAWTIVEKLKLTVWPAKDGRWICFQHEFDTNYGDEYWFGGEDFEEKCAEAAYFRCVIATTAPMAICKAALRTVGVEVKDG